MALDANPSSPTFNSYSTLAEADSYHATRLHNSAWTSANSADKESALIWATRNFETIDWKGMRTVPSQKFQFPRNMLFIDGGQYGYGSDALYSTWMFDSSTIPEFLKNATAEAAMWLLQSDTTAPVGTEGFKRIKVDTIELEIDRKDRLKWMNDAVRNIIWRYVLNSNKYMVPVERR